MFLLLQRHLAPARQEPIDKNLGGVWMRSALDQTDRTAAGRNMRALLPIDHVHVVHRQSLLVGPFSIAAAHAKRESSLGQPIGHLAPVAGIDGLLIDK